MWCRKEEVAESLFCVSLILRYDLIPQQKIIIFTMTNSRKIMLCVCEKIKNMAEEFFFIGNPHHVQVCSSSITRDVNGEMKKICPSFGAVRSLFSPYFFLSFSLVELVFSKSLRKMMRGNFWTFSCCQKAYNLYQYKTTNFAFMTIHV